MKKLLHERLWDDTSMYAACEGGAVEESAKQFADHRSCPHREGCEPMGFTPLNLGSCSSVALSREAYS